MGRFKLTTTFTGRRNGPDEDRVRGYVLLDRLLNRKDPWHASVVELSKGLAARLLVTTDEVLSELLAFFSAAGPHARQRVARFTRGLFQNPSVEVIPCSRSAFLAALDLYEARLDKGYSLSDCISMNAMRERGLVEVLTNDAHFRQEGFIVLCEPTS